MKFVPVKDAGVLFCIWKTRVQDFETFSKATMYNATSGMYSTTPEGQKRVSATWMNPGFTQSPTHPVCGVSWFDGREFCAWLTKKEQVEGRLLPMQAYRLPTDAEWSVAVGLGKEYGASPADKDGQYSDVYPWGQQWPPPRGFGNYAAISGDEDKYPQTSPVGSFPPNAFGLYDLGSNLREWCQDFNTDESDLTRVQRGASWNDNAPRALLSSTRRDANPGRRSDVYGFRCVLVTSDSKPVATGRSLPQVPK